MYSASPTDIGKAVEAEKIEEFLGQDLKTLLDECPAKATCSCPLVLGHKPD